jgi:hypothetical protein
LLDETATAPRRSADQIRQLFEPHDVEPYLAFISPYPLPVASLVVERRGQFVVPVRLRS